MPNVKISELTPASSADLSMQVEVDTGGTASKKMTLTQLKTLTRTYKFIHVPIHGFTYLSMVVPNADTVFNNNIYQTLTPVDLANFTQVRFNANIIDYCVNPSYFTLKYYTSFSVTYSDFVAIGTSAVRIPLWNPSYYRTSWIDLATGAKADGVYLVVGMSGGNDSTQVVMSRMHAEFR